MIDDSSLGSSFACTTADVRNAAIGALRARMAPAATVRSPDNMLIRIIVLEALAICNRWW